MTSLDFDHYTETDISPRHCAFDLTTTVNKLDTKLVIYTRFVCNHSTGLFNTDFSMLHGCRSLRENTRESVVQWMKTSFSTASRAMDCDIDQTHIFEEELSKILGIADSCETTSDASRWQTIKRGKFLCIISNACWNFSRMNPCSCIRPNLKASAMNYEWVCKIGLTVHSSHT